MQELEEAIAPLHAAAEAAAETQSAEERLTEIRSHDAAHTAGAGQSPGEPCLICQRTLPERLPATGTRGPGCPARRRTRGQKAKKAEQDAAAEHTKAQANAASAQRGHEKRQSATAAAQARLEQACQDAVAAMQELTRRQWGDGTGVSWRAGIRQPSCSPRAPGCPKPDDDAQDAAAQHVAQPAARPGPRGGEALAATAAAASKAAGKARPMLAQCSGEAVRAAGSPRAGRVQAHRGPETARTTPRPGVGRDLASLPGLVSELIPAEPLAITTGHIHVRAANRHRTAGAPWPQSRKTATRHAANLQKLAATQRQLDHRRSREVTDPLRALARYLERWQDAIEQAASVLAEDQLT